MAVSPDPETVLARLATKYGSPRHGNPRDIFLCAVYVLLSAQTTLEQAATALKAVRRRWPTASKLAHAPPRSLRKAINSCGFGTTRSEQLLALARAVESRSTSLRSLRGLSDNELEAELTALPGIGFKSARVIAAM